MKVYVVSAFKYHQALHVSECIISAVFETEADAEAFCANNTQEGWAYTIHGKDVVRNSSAEYKHPVVTSPAFDVNMSEEMYERYKKFVEGENK